MTTERKKSKARGHHYLSQCYLKGFTQLGAKESKLIGLNLNNKEVFSTTPKNVGKDRDFNRVEIDELPSDFLESALASFEHKVDKAMRNIKKTATFSEADRICVLNLIALFYVRNPHRRENWDDTKNHLANHLSKIMNFMATASIGDKSNGVLITENFKKFIDEDKQISRNKHIYLELKALLDNKIMYSLFHRKWALIQAPKGAVFVTCDNPVALMWIEPEKHKHSPGLNCTGTQIHFALSKKFALIGDFEGLDDFTEASNETVALINSNILLHAKKQAYASNQDFYFLNPFGECLYGIEKFWKGFNQK